MTDNVVRREIQRRDDPFGIPACFYWTIDEVADWVESIGYGKYKENFRSHFINGRKLLTVDACVLPKMGITHFGDILELAKFIRDQLRVRNDVRDFDVYELRQNSISRNHPCGKLRPNFSYQKHMHEVEQIINARLTFFRKRSIYYSGWSMADWWDEKLRAEENEMKEKQKRLGEDEDKRMIIGNTQQERLRQAAMREISFREIIPEWNQKLPIKRVKCPKDLPGLAESCLSERNIGHLNMTPAKFKCPASVAAPRPMTRRHKPIERSRPYLPIILHWKKMDKTTGYPQIKVSAGMFKCGYYTG
ncbi:unnamed protein product [Candidula unifasciata]|uniref:SAM domain-containing protein n=1 Tax=Candidula unifasciata TaxID=100452 RepID=A0A8S3YRU3_9EUPU|nr:unnamed protein product [Candidula unifasciata]